MKKKRNITALFGRDSEINARYFNLDFWRKCSDTQKMESAWELVVQAWKIKGKDPRELRLQRHIGLFKPE